MFDPTAFDNMKVIIEGAFYDMDLTGQIVITDRNDWVNIAKMSRLFTINFRMSEEGQGKTAAKMELESGLENLAAELLPGSQAEQSAGCYVKLQYFLEHANDPEMFRKIEELLAENWGSTREIAQTVQYNPLVPSETIKNVATVDFRRLVSEEQLDDLMDMIWIMRNTLQELNELIHGSQ
ncbi:hypothetical protein [Neobacillus sp. Marseille-QA0830]